MIGRGPTKADLRRDLEAATQEMKKAADVQAEARGVIERQGRLLETQAARIRELEGRPSVEALRTRALTAESLVGALRQKAEHAERDADGLRAKAEDARYAAAVDLGEPILAALLDMLQATTPYGLRVEAAILDDLKVARARTGQGREQRLEKTREALSELKDGSASVAETLAKLEDVFGPAEVENRMPKGDRGRLASGILMLSVTSAVPLERAVQLVERLYVTGSLAEPEPTGALRALMEMAMRCVDSADGRRRAAEYAFEVAEVINLGGFDLALGEEPV